MLRSPHHLPDEVFRNGAYFVSLTMCTANRARLFDDCESASVVRQEIERLDEQRSPVLAYCIMPDHVHVILIHRLLSLAETVRLLKGRASRRIRRDRPQLAVWQSGYYDHIIHRSEGIYRCLQYVLDNPVRKGLVTNWWNWPLSGVPALGEPGPDLFGAVNPENILWEELARGG